MGNPVRVHIRRVFGSEVRETVNYGEASTFKICFKLCQSERRRRSANLIRFFKYKAEEGSGYPSEGFTNFRPRMKCG